MLYTRVILDTQSYEKTQEYLKSGDFQSAIRILEEITRTDPANWKAFNRLGVAYAQAGHYETAIGAFMRAVQLNTRSANLRYNLGQAYEVGGVPLEALHEYEEALRLDPAYELARTALTKLRERLKSAPQDGI